MNGRRSSHRFHANRKRQRPLSASAALKAIRTLSQDHGAKRVRIFGSFARGTMRSGSDIDLLVEMDDGRTLLDLIALSRALRARLGRRVDIVTERSLSPHLRKRILAEARRMSDGDVYLRHIADALTRISQYVPADKGSFLNDLQCQDAVIRNLAVIGEAAKKVPARLRSQRPEVPWKDIAGMRDVLIHDYVSVDIELVWDTVQRDLPILEAAVEALLTQSNRDAA